jgi:transposase
MLKNRALASTAPRWVLEGPFSYAGCAPCQKQIKECDQQLAQYLARLEDRTQGATLPEETRKGRRKKKKGNPQFNLREELFRMTGTDLTQIDGFDVMAAMTVVSEVGWDMSKWKTENHFVSWLKLSPDNKISGGKVIGKGRLPTNNRATTVLRMAATALGRATAI